MAKRQNGLRGRFTFTVITESTPSWINESKFGIVDLKKLNNIDYFIAIYIRILETHSLVFTCCKNAQAENHLFL